MKTRSILIWLILPVILGIGASTYSLTDKTFVHISALQPELSHLDSIYVDARGFPNPMWAYNDPAISGYGEQKQAILWNCVLGNIILWSLFFYVIETPFVLIIMIVRLVKNRISANKGFQAIGDKSPQPEP